MANFDIKLIDSGFSAEIESLAGRISNPEPLYKSWANYLEGLAITAFKQEAAPFGGKWKELTFATQEAKRKREKPKSKNRILQDKGNLYDSIYGQATKEGAVVGTNLAVGSYSLGAIHQFGAPRANIDARPFLPLDPFGGLLPLARVELEELALDFLEQ